MYNIIKFFEKLEEAKKEAVILAGKIREAEAEKERLIKRLLKAEAECTRIREERDRYRSLCKIKDKIIRSVM